jgi:hypothetical protein
MLYILYVKIIQLFIIKEEPFRFLLYFPLCGFGVEVPEDGLSTGRNMLHTCKCTNWIKTNLCCVRKSQFCLPISITGWLP